jgi:hypothetical protein
MAAYVHRLRQWGRRSGFCCHLVGAAEAELHACGTARPPPPLVPGRAALAPCPPVGLEREGDSMQYQQRFEAALRTPDPGQALRALVTELSAEGLSEPEIYQLFEEELLHLRAAGRSAEEDVILDTLDALSGWCHPDARLLPDK